MRKMIAVIAVFLFIVNISPSYAGDKEQMGIDGGIGLSAPIGDFGDVANLGFGIQAAFVYYIMNQLAITGSLGYMTWGNDYDLSLYSIPLLIGMYYEFVLTKTFLLYAGLDIGLNFQTVGWSYLGFSGSDSDTKFGFVPKFGMLYALNKNISLRGGININVVNDGSYLSLMVGALFFLH